MSLRERFEQIMEEAIKEAEDVRCPIGDFGRGLLAMRAILQERIEHEGEIPGAVDDD